MLLGAAGETIWHVNGAAVACGRKGEPIAVTRTLTGDAATVAAESAAINADASFDPPIPAGLFKPFVLVTIPYDTETFNGGEVLGVSNNNVGGDHDKAIAVGYVIDNVYDTSPQPFMFTPKTDTVTMLSMDNGSEEFDYGKAIAISPNAQHIAGWAHEVSGNIEAVTWDYSNGYDIQKSLTLSTDSAWNAVEDNGAAAGQYTVSTHEETIADDGSGPYYPESSKAGVARGINSNGRVCGTFVTPSGPSHAYRWDTTSGDLDLHPAGGSYGTDSGANCINSSNDIGGWVSNSYDSHIAAHWAPSSLPGTVYEATILGDGTGSSYEVVAINSNREMIINRVDSTPGIAIWTHNSNAIEANSIQAVVLGETYDLILKPNTDDWMTDAWCMNDDLWIGGSYRVHDTGFAQPCLAIPYDVDNNGEPDYREIVESYEAGVAHTLDQYGYEWLIDRGENANPVENFPSGTGMRVGLNRPGYTDNDTDDITPSQIVRLALGLNNPDYPTSNIGDDGFYVNGIMASSNSQCGDFEAGLNHWLNGREIIMMLRSNLNDSDPDHDYLPDAPTVDLGSSVTKDDLLTNLHFFSYKFCRCIDWMQLGNEAFSTTDDTSPYYGEGGYLIYPNEVSNCWGTSGAREFEDMTSITCVNDAVAAVQDWDYEQMWAILRGSALAGRPLRIVGPGITSQAVLDGYDRDPTSYAHSAEIDQTASWCNDYQVWFDVHDRYKSVTDGIATITELWGYGGHYGWTSPKFAVCLELAPVVDEQLNTWWADGNDGLFPKFLNMPNCDQDPGKDWAEYISDPINGEGWKDVQFHGDDYFDLDDVTYTMYYPGASGGFAFTVVCYGSALQKAGSTHEPIFDLPALRAQQVCGDYITDAHKFSPLKTDYHDALIDYEIDTFDPHDTCAVCEEN